MQVIGLTCESKGPRAYGRADAQWQARDDGPFVHIELTEEGGGVRAYDLREYELQRHTKKGTPLYATIVEACQAPGTQIGISIGSVRPKCVFSPKSNSDGVHHFRTMCPIRVACPSIATTTC